MSFYRFDADRLVGLRGRVIEAKHELDALRCDDALAGETMSAVRATAIMLETSWRPALDELLTSPAVLHWQRRLEHTGDESVPSDDEESTTRASGGGVLARLILSGALARAIESLDRNDGWQTAVALLDRVLAQTGPRPQLVSPAIVELLITFVERLEWWTSEGRMAPETAWPPERERLVATMFLRQLAHPGGLIAIADAASRSTPLVRFLGRWASSIPPQTAAELCRIVLVADSGRSRWSATVSGELGPLLAIVANDDAALALLGDDETALRTLATHASIDPDAVEGVFAGLLGDASAPRRSLQRFASLVEIATGADLGLGAVRGAARAMSYLLPVLAVHLDRRRDIIVTTADAERSSRTTTVAIGSYADLSRLIGQILDDLPAQWVLGAVVGTMRIDRERTIARLLAEVAPANTARAVALVGGQLADGSRALELIDHARLERTRLVAFHHAVAQAGSEALRALLSSAITIAATMAATPGFALTRQIGAFSSQVLAEMMGSDEPPTVPSTGLEAEASLQFLRTVIALPARNPGLRELFGLESLDHSTWRMLNDLLDDLELAPSDRWELASQLEFVVAQIPEFDAYFEQISALSGDGALD